MNRIIGFGIILISLVSCQYSFQLKNDVFLTEKIESLLKSDNGKINFSQLNDFEWDNLIILGPYSTMEEIGEKLNLNLKNISNNGIRYSDYYHLIVFLKNNKSVKIVELKKAMQPIRTIINKEKSLFVTDSDGILKLTE